MNAPSAHPRQSVWRLLLWFTLLGAMAAVPLMYWALVRPPAWRADWCACAIGLTFAFGLADWWHYRRLPAVAGRTDADASRLLLYRRAFLGTRLLGVAFCVVGQLLLFPVKNMDAWSWKLLAIGWVFWLAAWQFEKYLQREPS